MLFRSRWPFQQFPELIPVLKFFSVIIIATENDNVIASDIKKNKSALLELVFSKKQLCFIPPAIDWQPAWQVSPQL